MKNQEKIDREIEEVDKKLRKKEDEKKRLGEESDRKALRQMEERNRQIHESGDKYYRLYEEKNRQVHESGYRFQQQLFKNSHKFHEGSFQNYDDITGGARGSKGLKEKKGLFKTTAALFGKKAQQEQDLTETFAKIGFKFDEITESKKILDDHGNVIIDFNLIMENTNFILVIEDCSKPKQEDIEQYAKMLFLLRRHREKYQDTRKIHGAFKSKKFSAAEKQMIFEAGLIVIEPSGGELQISMPEGAPRDW